MMKKVKAPIIAKWFGFYLPIAAIGVFSLAAVGYVTLETSAVPEPEPAAVGGSAIKAFIDPETGKLRAPNQQELQAMRASGEGPVALPGPTHVTRHADGMLVVGVPRERRMQLNAQRQPDGTLRLHHGQGAGHE